MKPADQTPFRGISGRNKKRCASKLPRLRRCRKYTADLLHMAVKAEFAKHHRFPERPGRNPAERHQNARCNRKIETRSFFSNVRRGQINRNSFRRQGNSHVFEGCPHAVLRLLYLGIHVADHRKLRHAVTDIRLHLHRNHLHARDGG